MRVKMYRASAFYTLAHNSKNVPGKHRVDLSQWIWLLNILLFSMFIDTEGPWIVQILRSLVIALFSQGRNQDLNLVKQKYETLTGHKIRC